MSADEQKRAAAERAAAEAADGMVVGLGSGSTAEFALAALARRALRIVCIPSSERTAGLARELGLTLAGFDTHSRIDLDIDGADRVVTGTLDLVKGHGGSLLREKIVAAASARMIAIVDETKLVDRLGPGTVVPVEIERFGHENALGRLADDGATPRLRMRGAAPFVTDGGHFIADCAFADIPDPGALERRLKSIVGVIESGLFVGVASEIFVGRAGGGVDILRR